MTEQTPIIAPSTGKDAALWVALLLGPIAWFVNFQFIYAFAAVACKTGKQRLYISCTIAMAVVLIGTALAIWLWFTSREVEPDPLAERLPNRAHFMSVLAVMSNLLFLLTIIAQTIAGVMLDPCWD